MACTGRSTRNSGESVHWVIDLAYLKGVRDALLQLEYSLFKYRKDPLIDEIVEFLESSLHELDEMNVHDERSLPPFSHLGFKNLERRVEDLMRKTVQPLREGASNRTD